MRCANHLYRQEEEEPIAKAGSFPGRKLRSWSNPFTGFFDKVIYETTGKSQNFSKKDQEFDMEFGTFNKIWIKSIYYKEPI